MPDELIPPTQTDNPSGPVAVVTGSTGNSIQDGTARSFFIGLLVFAVGKAESELDWFTDAEMAVLLALVAAGVVQAAGWFDRYIKPRLPKA